MCKDITLLENKIDMSVTIYAFDAEDLDVQQTAEGKQITASEGVKIPAPDAWLENVENNVNQMIN